MRFVLSVAIVLVLGAACQPLQRGQPQGQASDEWSRSYPLSTDGEVQIVAGSGNVDVQGGTGSTVEVRAERMAQASSDDAARELLPRIRIREDITPERVVLQTEGLGGIVIGVEVRVNYHVVVPTHARVRVRTANGAVTVANIEGRVVLSSANGEVIGKNLRGGVDARSVNKAVTVELSAFGAEPVEVRSTNGDVDLTLPVDANASFDANCTNGKIEISDFTLEPFGEQTRRRVRGRLNQGGTPIDVTSVNGNIRVRARR